MARVEPAVQSGGLLKLYQALWAPYYQAVLSVLGSTGVVLPLGDPHPAAPGQGSIPSLQTFAADRRVDRSWQLAGRIQSMGEILVGPLQESHRALVFERPHHVEGALVPAQEHILGQ